MSLSDEELARELCPDDIEVGRRVVALLSPEKREAYERLIDTADKLNLWQAGLWPMPADVIVTKPRGRFRR